MKNIKSLVMVGLLSAGMLVSVGCQSTKENNIESEWKPKMTEEEYLKVAEEIEEEAKEEWYNEMYVELNEDSWGYNTYFLSVVYVYNPLTDTEGKRERIVDEMREYYEEVNEEYGQDGLLRISVEVYYDENTYYLFTSENEFDEYFLDRGERHIYPINN